MRSPRAWPAPRRQTVVLALLVVGSAIAAVDAWAQQVRESEETSRADSELDRAALEARQRESAELLVSRREALDGRRFDARYREWLIGTLAAQKPESLQQLASGADGGGSILEALGDSAADLVYTPVTPCRVLDTRSSAAGILVGGTQQNFWVAGTTGFPAQGGHSGGCGIPVGPATSVIINFVAVTPTGAGNLRAWAVASPQPAAPLAAVLNFSPTLAALANGIAVPICNAAQTSCAAGDLRLQADSSSVHVVGDVVGYFAAPTATTLDCLTVSSAVASVPNNVWTPVDANCPAGRTATGGGYDTVEGTLGYPGVWLTSVPNGNGWRTWVDNQTGGSRGILTYVRCCRLPGR